MHDCLRRSLSVALVVLGVTFVRPSEFADAGDIILTHSGGNAGIAARQTTKKTTVTPVAPGKSSSRSQPRTGSGYPRWSGAASYPAAGGARSGAGWAVNQSIPAGIRVPYIPGNDVIRGGVITPADCQGFACPFDEGDATPITGPGLPQGNSPQAPAPAGAPAAAGPGAAPAPVVINVAVIAQEAASSIHLPTPEINLGPDPSVNEWHMIAVGLPVWFWTNEPPAIDASLTAQGIALSLVAHHDGTTIDTGDGNSITCATSTPRPTGAAPMESSPDCGHTWLTHGDPTITASSTWTITWSALGQSGSIPLTRTATRTIHVGQLASVLVK